MVSVRISGRTAPPTDRPVEAGRREIDPKTRLVYTEGMADADGNAMTAEQMGMPDGTPMETSIVVELEDRGDRTKMTMTHIGVPADSPGGQGWAMAIDKMEARVAELRS